MRRRGIWGFALLALLALPGAAKDDGPFGAIAYSDTHKNAYTSNCLNSEAEAEADALKQCHDNAPDDQTCSIAVWWSNGCGAYAKTDDGETWGTGWGSTPELAKQYAVKTCRDFGGQNCKARIVACSPGGYFEMN